jgi:hypothetical protein
MSREYIGSFKVSGVSPKQDYEGDLSTLKTVGLKLTLEEARALKNELDAAIQHSTDWKFLNLTAYRETNQVTITFYKPV